MTYDLLPHQAALITSLHRHRNITYFFDIAGFGSGKSFADVVLLLSLIGWYNGHYLTFGIGGAAIKHLRETVIKDFLEALDRHAIAYKHNAQTGIITVGTLSFVYFTLDKPDSIFGHNFAGALLDEADELEVADRVRQSTIAVQERCRVSLPPTNDGHPARPPFITFTTTAQGMRGIYLLLTTFDERKIPYVLIRGRTRDNTHLDTTMIQNLYSLYTPDEARAYLDGEFVNLTSGRVYYEFNPSTHIHQPFPITDTETIFVGQDFNPGFNAAVVMVVRGTKAFVVSEHHWDAVGDAPYRLRQIYPNNPIILIPDVNGKELMSAYKEEFERYAIEVSYSGRINPSITDRILVVNKLIRTDRLYVFPGCIKVARALQLRDFDDSGNPRKEKGPNALDHHADALEYAIWTIIHRISAFGDLIDLLISRGRV